MALVGQGCCTLPPTYVRAVEVTNKTGATVTLGAQFEKNSQTFTVEQGATVRVEGSIDMGTWTAVDPLKTVTVYGPDNNVLAERTFQSESGVKVFAVELVTSAVKFVDVARQ